MARSTKDLPLIGIWWDDGDRIAALSHLPVVSGPIAGGFIDSHLEHWREWPNVAPQFGRSANDEFFHVPRGRVLMRRQTGQGMIYHGSATTQARLALIAAEFKLENWKAAVDLHYEVGDAADALFDDD
ncbi:hypothetical protein [Lacipirellula parvula]|uniref:Uncharacterized protein n=1 Tax=Lacipirellula parvula TaxID=2650471 RepID=A0A5K7X404_9BACT|nr:hypothetical protein [Lacipirellula parvula]BBO31095.1 hypothetical protein PLANPX_0707 [Lacipirellula parvula]